ncbi:MAG: sigma-54 dependent transcriptional regulator [Gemmatimonadetes bacterium]|nr:sigma-54 dependent transcriptional regulator [Gemmatimonadota bacterium]
MAETVLITVQDLEPAVRLRDAFVADGLEVELLTAGEHIAGVADPVLLVLTGHLDQKQARRLLREAAGRDRLPVIALVDSPAEATAAARRALGIAEAFVKPIDPEEVALVGRRLIERSRLREVTGIIGETNAMIEVLERVVQIAPVSSTVLVTGESGTGKERIARGIHALSPRRHRPFIAANVAALPETLLESELFGHEKGAFTGAIGQRKGFFELANKGTLFLDEIGEMPMATQTKLLRALEEREFMRLGGEQPITVDVRFIAATNQNLRDRVETGGFRRDLYYRLNVLNIHLPPLRQRREDIPLLVEHFIHETSRQHDRPRIQVSPEAMRILIDSDWPGNVRELANLVESMVVLAPGTVIRPEDIPDEIRHGPALRSLALPVPVPRLDARDGAPASPELEFVFRTLIQMRMDIEELRRRFDEYRDSHPELAAHAAWRLPLAAAIEHRAIEAAPIAESRDGDRDESAGEDEGTVVYRPGMTLREIEEAAITAALNQVKGNRRRAAEMLGMGERTLYRKIKEYGIPL